MTKAHSFLPLDERVRRGVKIVKEVCRLEYDLRVGARGADHHRFASPATDAEREAAQRLINRINKVISKFNPLIQTYLRDAAQQLIAECQRVVSYKLDRQAPKEAAKYVAAYCAASILHLRGVAVAVNKRHRKDCVFQRLTAVLYGDPNASVRDACLATKRGVDQGFLELMEPEELLLELPPEEVAV